MRQGHNVMIKGSLIQQEEITVINIYDPKARTAKYIKQTLLDLKREILIVIVADFNIPLSSLGKPDRSQQRHIKLHRRPSGPSTHLQSISSNCVPAVFQHMEHSPGMTIVRPQNKSQQIQNY